MVVVSVGGGHQVEGTHWVSCIFSLPQSTLLSTLLKSLLYKVPLLNSNDFHIWLNRGDSSIKGYIFSKFGSASKKPRSIFLQRNAKWDYKTGLTRYTYEGKFVESCEPFSSNVQKKWEHDVIVEFHLHIHVQRDKAQFEVTADHDWFGEVARYDSRSHSISIALTVSKARFCHFCCRDGIRYELTFWLLAKW